MDEREQRFCEEYLVDLDARAAAERAGYRPGTAKCAARWIDAKSARFKPDVSERIQALKAERSRRTGITADRVLREYARIAFANIAEITDGERVLQSAGPENMAAIASLKIKTGPSGTDCDVRMYDKLKALDMLGRHLGMFDGGDGGPGSMPRITVNSDGSVMVDGGD